MPDATLFGRLSAAWARGQPSAGALWAVIQQEWMSGAQEREGSLHADWLWLPVDRDDGQQLIHPPAELEGHEPLVWGQFYSRGQGHEDGEGVAIFFPYDESWAAALAPAGPPAGHQFLLEWDAPCQDAEQFVRQLAGHRLMATMLTANALQAWWFDADEDQRL